MGNSLFAIIRLIATDGKADELALLLQQIVSLCENSD